MKNFLLFGLIFSLAFSSGIVGGMYGRVVLAIILSSLDMTIITKTIYVDTTFNDQEYEAITAAGAEWNYYTKKLVKFNFVRGMDQNTYNSIRNDPDKIAMFKINDGDTSTTQIDEFFKGKKVGCFLRYDNIQLIYVVASRIDSILTYEKVVAHEFGHALGIDHLNNPKDIMDEYVHDDAVITKDDIRSICEFYLCWADKY